ncbi:MAG: hypothetical protein ACRCYZ_01415 [Alphaproteobacteria bacterium]
MEEIRTHFPEAQFHFSDMGPTIEAKFQKMQQQDAWKDKISFDSESEISFSEASSDGTETYYMDSDSDVENPARD